MSGACVLLSERQKRKLLHVSSGNQRKR